MTTSARHPALTFGRGLRDPAIALALLCSLTMAGTQSAQAQTFSVIHSFTGGGDGAIPQAGLTMDVAGNFYGTASSGGYQGTDQCRINNGCGVVFKLTHQGSAWVLQPLYSFQGGDDGSGPLSRVIPDPDGLLYGTTYGGGGPGCTGTGGCGTVYSVTPVTRVCSNVFCGWTETVLYRFSGGSDGANPFLGDLIFDQAGNLYGTTIQGGDNDAGVVFELAHSGDWTESPLYSFAVATGAYPESGVIFDSAGNLYGTAAGSGLYGYGMVYQLKPSHSGWTENTLYSFQGHGDGGGPVGGLIFDRAGNLYGTTTTEGPGTNGGTVYELTNVHGSWSFVTLYGISGGSGGPYGSLNMDAAGNLYGTTYSDGAFGFGSVFKLAPQSDGTWLYTDLHDFTGRSDGRSPEGSLLVDANGNLFGTASDGGDLKRCFHIGCGVIWEITP